jgi:hypothetical protein
MEKRDGWQRFPVRNAEFGQRFELFLVAAVISVLGIRWYLAATGYPQIGGQGIHFAHVLWGGIFMLLALFIHSAFLNRSLHRAGAICAGIGFGTFIDELGKFITSDNNYFFQPTIALIYVVFILIYIIVRIIYTRHPFTPREALANCLSLMADAVAGRLHADQKRRTLELLESADQAEPLVQQVRAFIERADPQARMDMGSYFRIRSALHSMYRFMIRHRWFRYLMVSGFVANTLWQLLTVSDIIIDLPLASFDRASEGSTFVSAAQAISLLASGLLVVVGLCRLPESRLDAYRWFQRSVLVQILVTQVFVFYDSQLGAIGGLLINLLVYVGFSVAIAHLQDLEAPVSPGPLARAAR